jgi:predicted PurR-regulated permease PerM
MTRTLVLAVALAFILGFAFLTISSALEQGLTIGSLLSAFILLLLFVGIVGALFNPPRQ